MALETLIPERLEPHLGRTLDFGALGEDLAWVTGSEHFDRVRYEATGDHGLLIVARKKSNDPPFVRFGLDITNEALDLAVGFRARLIALRRRRVACERIRRRHHGDHPWTPPHRRGVWR